MKTEHFVGFAIITISTAKGAIDFITNIAEENRGGGNG